VVVSAVVGAVLGALAASLGDIYFFACRDAPIHQRSPGGGFEPVACPAPDVLLVLAWGVPIGLAVGLVVGLVLSKRLRPN
jgi:hypothetical protein